MPAWLSSKLLPWGLLALAIGIGFAVWKWDDSTVKELRSDNALMQHVNEENQKVIVKMQIDEKRRQEADAILADDRTKRAVRLSKVKVILQNAPASENGPVPPLVQRFLDGLYEDGGAVPVH